MINKIIIIFIGLLFFVSTATSSTFIKTIPISPQSQGDILYVGGSGPGNYTLIQDAIDNASDDDSVFVFNDGSPYKENIIISKSIMLKGEDKETTTLDGNNQGNTIIIEHNNVQVSGFTLSNGGGTAGVLEWYIAGIRITASQISITNNVITNNRIGIFIKNSEQLNIENNTFINDCLVIAPYDQEAFYTPFIEDYFLHNIINNTVNGKPLYYYHHLTDTTLPSDAGQIILVSSQKNIIQNTHISGTDFALILINSSSNIIRNNTLTDGPAGLLWLLYSTNNQLLNNTISNNLEGICLDQASSQNTISYNTLDNNSHCNLMIESKSHHNKIYKNNLIGTTRVQAYLLNTFQTSFMHNYWEGHTNSLPRIVRGELTLSILPTLRLPWFGVDWKPTIQPNTLE